MLPLEAEIDLILNEHFPNGLPVSRTSRVLLSGNYEVINSRKRRGRKRSRQAEAVIA